MAEKLHDEMASQDVFEQTQKHSENGFNVAAAKIEPAQYTDIGSVRNKERPDVCSMEMTLPTSQNVEIESTSFEEKVTETAALEKSHLEDVKGESKMETDINETETVSSCDNGSLKLIDLPAEILFYLASFLDSKDIIESLCPSCHYLNDLFSDERYWKTRISLRWPKPYPVIMKDFCWRSACMEREECHKQWTDPDEHFHHFVYKDGFFASVDVVQLMKGGRYLAVGSRDRHMNILDLSRFDPEHPKDKKNLSVFSNGKIHKGWVWSMAQYDDTLITGSWDTHIRLWDTGDGTVQEAGDVKLKTAILGLYAEPGFIAAGAYDKRLYMFDPRDPRSIIRKRYHDQPLLCVAANSKYVITGSEDKVVSVYDRVAGKNYRKIDIDSFVMDMSYNQGQLWIGDKEGRLRVIDARDGLFDENNIQTVDVGHNGKLTGVVQTDGGIFTCSTDSTVKVVEPTLEPSIINTLTCHSEAVAGLSYQNGVLVSAGTDISVGVWMPKSLKF